MIRPTDDLDAALEPLSQEGRDQLAARWRGREWTGGPMGALHFQMAAYVRTGSHADRMRLVHAAHGLGGKVNAELRMVLESAHGDDLAADLGFGVRQLLAATERVSPAALVPALSAQPDTVDVGVAEGTNDGMSGWWWETLIHEC